MEIAAHDVEAGPAAFPTEFFPWFPLPDNPHTGLPLVGEERAEEVREELRTIFGAALLNKIRHKKFPAHWDNRQVLAATIEDRPTIDYRIGFNEGIEAAIAIIEPKKPSSGTVDHFREKLRTIPAVYHRHVRMLLHIQKRYPRWMAWDDLTG